MLLLRCKEEARDEEPISHLSKDQDAETIDVSRSFFRTFGLSDFRTSGPIYKIKTSSSSTTPQ